jgi:hypothetical protein
VITTRILWITSYAAQALRAGVVIAVLGGLRAEEVRAMSATISTTDPSPLPDAEQLAWVEYLLSHARGKLTDVVEYLERGFDYRKTGEDAEGRPVYSSSAEFDPVSLEEYGRLTLLAEYVQHDADALADLHGRLHHVAYMLYEQHNDKCGAGIAGVVGVEEYPEYLARVRRGFENELKSSKVAS